VVPQAAPVHRHHQRRGHYGGHQNVTIDCNDFKIGGLAAGPTSVAQGIFAQDRLNLTVRNCSLRGFQIGIGINGTGGGHVVEDNRIDQSLNHGIVVQGDNNLVKGNLVFDTGGKPGGLFFAGIRADADVIDNTVSGVLAVAPTSWPFGILVNGDGHLAQGNRVRNVIGPDGASGIVAEGGEGHVFAENLVDSHSFVSGKGIVSKGTCRANSVRNFAVPYDFCWEDAGNSTL
jgi:parallel beta-helix repeat protein